MSNKKPNILIAIIGYVITISIIIVAIILLNNYKDVPVISQHFFGHDLDSYKIYAYWMIGIFGIVAFIATSIFAFSEEK